MFLIGGKSCDYYYARRKVPNDEARENVPLIPGGNLFMICVALTRGWHASMMNYDKLIITSQAETQQWRTGF